jgi:hypothetical protein
VRRLQRTAAGPSVPDWAYVLYRLDVRVRITATVLSLTVVAACGGQAPSAATPNPTPPISSASATASPSTPAASTTPAASGGPALPAATFAPTGPPGSPLSTEQKDETPTRTMFAPGLATKHSGCKASGALPDSACTPGAVMTKNLDVICHHATRDRRHVTASVHKQAFTEYGYTFPQGRGAFEVDHLIPLELGGDNTIENIWAEPANPVPGFHEKDRVENFLHKQVCSGAMTLDDAQKAIASDCLGVWRNMNGGGN